jgi:hypothetical protein
MKTLIEMEDLDVIAGLTVEENDPDLCECGKGPNDNCGKGPCPLMPAPADERFPSAETRWYLGY